MVSLELTIAIGTICLLIGTMIGVAVGPVWHATTTALNQMGEAVEQDVDAGDQ